MLADRGKIERQQFEDHIGGDAENADERIPLTKCDADDYQYPDQVSVGQVLLETVQRRLASNERKISVGMDKHPGEQTAQQQDPQEIHAERTSRYDHGGNATGSYRISDSENARTETQNRLDYFRHYQERTKTVSVFEYRTTKKRRA